MTSRFAAATLLIAVPSLIALGRYAADASEFYATRPPADHITQIEARWAGVRQMLPDRGVLGYVTDEGIAADDPNAQAEFYLAQYALAPVVLTRAGEPRYTVGNFHKPAPADALAARGLRVVKEFGNGIMLLERQAAVR